MNDIKIDKKHPTYDKRREQWEIGELLIEGTIAMQENNETTLPRFAREEDKNYNARVKGAVLYNAVAEKVEKFQKKPFSEKVKFSEDLPESWQFIMNDIDGKGMTIDAYLERNIRDRLIYGHSLRLVNMPSLYDEKGRKLSPVDVKNKKLHPYISRVAPNSLINWYFDDKKPVMMRIQYEKEVFRNGEVKIVKMIDEHTPSNKIVYEYREGAKDIKQNGWIQISESKNALKEIPLQVIGGFYDKSLIQDMSYMNLSHFRSQSILDSYANIAGTPFLFFKGFDKKSTETTVSVHQAYHNSSINSSVEWIELKGGKGIELLMSKLEATEAKLQASGADLVTNPNDAQTTATENVINEDDKLSPLQSIVVDEMNAFKETLRLIGLWKNETPPDVDLIIFKDFNISRKASQRVDQLLKMRVAGTISKELYFKELVKLNFFVTEFDAEREIALTNQEFGL